MATPTVVCPACRVRFPVKAGSSASAKCPDCGHRFAAKAERTEPVPAKIVDKVDDRPEPRRPDKRSRRDDDDVDLRPGPRKSVAKRVESARAGFRLKNDAEDDAAPAPRRVFLLVGAILGGVAVLGAVILLMVMGTSAAPEPAPDVAADSEDAKPKRVVEPPEPESRFAVMPPVTPVPQPRTGVKQKTTVELPDWVDDVCVGGGGRFMILRMHKSKQFAVLDLCEGKVVKLLPVDEANAPFAAGMSHLFVYLPKANAFQRWSLETFEKEATVKNAVGGTPTRLLMGHSTDGPLYVGGKQVFTGHYALLHPATFEPVLVTAEGGESWPGISDYYPPVVRVSGDGRVYGWHKTGGVSPEGFDSMVITGKTAKSYHQHETVSPILPGPDGTLFTGFGRYTPDQKELGKKSATDLASPATAGRWFAEFTYPKTAGAPRRDIPLGLAVGSLDDPALMLPVPDSDGVISRSSGAPWQHFGSVIWPMDAVVLNPRAGVAAVLADDRWHVHLLPFDLKGSLAKGEKDYLLVMGQPSAAVWGEKWAYTPEVWSKGGKATATVATGPPGMTAAGDTVSWAVPKDFAGAEAEVTLKVTEGKQETLHSFTLPVRRKK